ARRSSPRGRPRGAECSIPTTNGAAWAGAPLGSSCRRERRPRHRPSLRPASAPWSAADRLPGATGAASASSWAKAVAMKAATTRRPCLLAWASTLRGLVATLFGQFPYLEKLFADSAYEGPVFHAALAGILPHLTTEIVKRSDRIKGFVALPR